MTSRCRISCRSTGRRHGMTLVEMLIATTITLIIMGFVAEMFNLFGTGVADSRSVIEMTDQMRAVAHRLRQDLAGVTAPTLPPLDPEQQQGYFEYIEGPASDLNAAAGGLLDAADTTQLTADCDDVLLFTSRSSSDPFVGRFQNGTIESPTAEIGWFCKRSQPQVPGGPTLYTLYRRQLLVMSYVGAEPFLSAGNQLDWATSFPNGWLQLFSQYDLSCRLQTEGGPVFVRPNTLGDLTKRENRFLHLSAYPHAWDFADSLSSQVLAGSRLGEDVVLSNVLSFDVRAFDPNAPIQVRGGGLDAVAPGDPGFNLASAGIARGAYVDLNWQAAAAPASFPLPPGVVFPPAGASAFSGQGVAVVNGSATNLLGTATYDTWSTHYESDGVDQDDDGIDDEASNGFDDDADGRVDDVAERETSPPYPVALRGIEIRIRCYEPSSRQIRQVTVRHTFVPH